MTTPADIQDSDFRPDWTSPPGDTIRALVLKHRPGTPDHGIITTLSLALRLSIPEAVMLLAGTLPITAELAQLLSAKLGGSALFWSNRERLYRQRLAEQQEREDSWTQQAGKWACSTNEEHFQCSEVFDTREDAIAYALDVLAYEYDVDDGGRVYTGMIRPLMPSDVAPFDGDDVIERASERLYDHVNDDVCNGIDASPGDTAELERRLNQVFVDWMIETKSMPKVCAIEAMQSHVYFRCTAERDGETCSRHKEHDGDHDF